MDISHSLTLAPITPSPTDFASDSSGALTTQEDLRSTTSDSTSDSIREHIKKDPQIPNFIGTEGEALPSTHRMEVVSKGVVPVRLAKAYREIDEAKMVAITAAEQKAERAHARNFRRGGNQAATFDIESKKNQEIKIATQRAEEAKAILVRGAASTPDISNISGEEKISTHAGGSDLYQSYAEQFAQIKKEEMAAIEVAENRALQTNALMIRPGGGIGINLLIEEKKRAAINQAEQTATRKKNILFIHAKNELLTHQANYFEEIFENYSERLYSGDQIFSGHRALDGDHFDLAATQASIQETFQLERELLAAVEHPQQESDDLLLEDIVFFDRANTTRLNALKPFVELSIDQALTEIETSTNSLDQSIQRSRGNPFVDQTSMKEIRAELLEARTSYFAAEAVSREGRGQVALQNVLNLQKRIETTKTNLVRLSRGEAIVRSADHAAFSEAVSSLKGHLQHLENIQQSYQQIVVDCSLSKTTLPVRSQQERVLTEESRSLPTRNGIFQKLNDLSRSQPSSPQETKLNILLELEHIPKEQEENFILGSRGEIKFVAPSTIETATSRSKQDGLNLVRLAIFRDYGEAGLRRFDRHFNTELVSEHPISVGQLMDFVDEENKVNPKAFYLSSIHSLHELIVAESHSEDDNKLIQAGSGTFKLTSTKDDRGTDSTPAQKKQAALKATRHAINEFFKELPSEKRQHILSRFNDEFKGEEAKPLTVQNLRSFLKKELENEKSLLSRSPVAEALFYSVALQSVVTLWGTVAPAASTILGGWPAFFVTFGLAMVHDLTTTWRELQPEE